MKKQILNSVRRFCAFILAVVMSVQMVVTYGFEENQINVNEDGNTSFVYTNETTSEILELIDQGLNLETFFKGDLTVGITEEDLIQWQSEGKDIRDIVRERALSYTDAIDYANCGTKDNISQDMITARATPSGGKYYLTQVEKYFNGCNVNLNGTNYEGELFNPKTSDSGSGEPWYISLGGEQAMCCTYAAHASIRTDHNYVENNVDRLKDNQYFKGNSTYPLEKYFMGAAYAYETLTYPESYTSGAGKLNAGLQELVRKSGGELVYRSGKTINYAVFQIITWRIAQGSFNPMNMEREKSIAKCIFGQMYPPEEWNDTYYECIEAFYEYYALCAKECASGKYNEKYNGVSVKYWQVQGADSNNWQDFITWKVPFAVTAKDEFKVKKTGKVMGTQYYPNATFFIYSDRECSNKIGEFTTDSSGQSVIKKIVEGIYYLKEVKAPVGTVLNNTTMTLTVEDSVDSTTISNEEFYNGVFFRKYDSFTSEIITTPGAYAIYEYVNGKYLKIGSFSFREKGFTNSKGIVIPDYSYVLTSQDMTYHYTDETTYKVKSSNLYYTPVNQGKFKIVEETAPPGYNLDINGKDFVMNLKTQGYVHDFSAYEKGVKDTPNAANVKIRKFDYFTGVDLWSAGFKIQEKVNGKWYDVGELVEETDNYEGNVYPIYTTSYANAYKYHNNSGEVSFVRTGSKSPLICTPYNNGMFRIVETKAPVHYQGNYIKTFSVKPKVNNYTYEFTSYSMSNDNSVTNRGISISVKALKYDDITREIIKNSLVPATLTLYEHIDEVDKWYEIGKLSYSKDTNEYVMTSDYSYKLHDAKGNEIKTSINGIYIPGRLYYTSANKGRFKVVETSSPSNYLMGMIGTANKMISYEKEFNITPETEDGKVIDFTDFDSAAKDTGVSSNLEVSKYDTLTGDKVEEGNAEFTVYENVNGKWLEFGDLVYNGQENVYQSVGMMATYHNSKGMEIHKSVITEQTGLTYTTANLGRFKVVETKAPSYYQNSGFEKEFNIDESIGNDTIRLDSYSDAARDLGFSGTVEVAKYDNLTREKVKEGNAEFTVYEYVGNQWHKAGILSYDENTEKYVCDNSSFTFHNNSGIEISVNDIADYQTGRLYYTSANKGRFKVVETRAPENYTIENLLNEETNVFEEEFIINTDNKKVSYDSFATGARNNGEYTYVELKKYDAITKQVIDASDAIFAVQELIGDEWIDVCKLKYDKKTGCYVSNGTKVTLHNSEKKETYTDNSGRLYYTTSNEGRYRVVEVKAPEFYTIGSEPYIYEFFVNYKNDVGVINLTELIKAPQDLGVYGVVEVAKYDKITREKVKTGDAEFTIYEHIDNQWMEVGKLSYDEKKMIYGCDGITCVFHDKEGNIVDTSEIRDYEIGRLYYTSANHGDYKITETSAPENYILDDNTVMFNICSDREIESHLEESNFVAKNSVYDMKMLSFDTINSNAAQNKGITGNIELMKTDKDTDKPLEGAVFALQEWSVKSNGWLFMGNLKDMGNGMYTTRETSFEYHTDILSDAGSIMTEKQNELVYTSQNLGKFRLLEMKAPEGYMNDSFEREIQLTEEQTIFDLTDSESRATDTPIKVSLSKRSITTGKNITGASLMIKDMDGNIVDSWISDDSEHVISGIKTGKYIFVEESAPAGYIKARSVEFEVTETYDIQKVEMFDEVVQGKVIIHKTDKDSGNKLKGAKFELKAKDGTFSQILITDENGYAESDLIGFGIYDVNGKYLGSREYILTEISAPPGYDIDRTSHNIIFDYKDDKTEVVEMKLDISNIKIPPVETGDRTSKIMETIIALMSTVILCAGLCVKKRE